VTTASEKRYDITIAGAGMVGITAAIVFARCGFSVALVDPKRPTVSKKESSFDQRSVALSASSVMIYQSLGIWSELSAYACPIKRIMVSNQGYFGFTRLNADDYEYDALGQVVCLEEVEPLFYELVSQEKNIDYFSGMQVIAGNNTEKNCEVTIQVSELSSDVANEPLKRLNTKLLIAADGTYSKLAQQKNIQIKRQPYQQTAFVTNVITEKHHENCAYERFTSGGPLALLPLPSLSTTANLSKRESRMGLVWCHQASEAERVSAWNDELFIKALQKAFGFRLGKIMQIGKRFSYPLSLHLAQKPFQNRFLLLGNAAHTLHPIAGQGFNLGLRDVAYLADDLLDAVNQKKPFHDECFLSSFVKKRQSDWSQTQFATDSLTRLFSHSSLPLALLRNKGMQLINRLDCLKNHLAINAMGFKQSPPGLVRGISSIKYFNN
jgi:2-octaprenyl-6-methoxyphenol hydroxylase